MFDGPFKSDIGSSDLPKENESRQEKSEKALIGRTKGRKSVGDCPYCSKKINNQLKRHINLVHLKVGFMTCKFCSRKFGQKRDYLRHMAAAHPLEMKNQSSENVKPENITSEMTGSPENPVKMNQSLDNIAIRVTQKKFVPETNKEKRSIDSLPFNKDERRGKANPDQVLERNVNHLGLIETPRCSSVSEIDQQNQIENDILARLQLQVIKKEIDLELLTGNGVHSQLADQIQNKDDSFEKSTVPSNPIDKVNPDLNCPTKLMFNEHIDSQVFLDKDDKQTGVDNSPGLKKGFNCTICHQKFIYKRKCEYHLSKVHRIKERETVEKCIAQVTFTPNPRKRKRFDCNSCSLSFNAKKALERHQMESHVSSHQTDDADLLSYENQENMEEILDIDEMNLLQKMDETIGTIHAESSQTNLFSQIGQKIKVSENIPSNDNFESLSLPSNKTEKIPPVEAKPGPKRRKIMTCNPILLTPQLNNNSKTGLEATHAFEEKEMKRPERNKFKNSRFKIKKMTQAKSIPITENPIQAKSIPITENPIQAKSIPITENPIQTKSIPIIKIPNQIRSIPIVENGLGKVTAQCPEDQPLLDEILSRKVVIQLRLSLRGKPRTSKGMQLPKKTVPGLHEEPLEKTKVSNSNPSNSLLREDLNLGLNSASKSVKATNESSQTTPVLDSLVESSSESVKDSNKVLSKVSTESKASKTKKLKREMDSKTSEEIMPKIAKLDLRKPKKLVLWCTKCQKSFSAPHQLQNHLTTEHWKQDQEQSICKQKIEENLVKKKPEVNSKIEDSKKSDPVKIQFQNTNSAGKTVSSLDTIRESNSLTAETKPGAKSKMEKSRKPEKRSEMLEAENRFDIKTLSCEELLTDETEKNPHMKGDTNEDQKLPTETYRMSEKSLFGCEICLETFQSKKLLKRHANKMHSENAQSDDAKEKVFSCDFCPESFRRKKQLIAHKSEVHPKVKRDKRLRAANFRCTFCDESFTKLLHLKKHTLQVHSNLDGHFEAKDNADPIAFNMSNQAKTFSDPQLPSNVQDCLNIEDSKEGLSFDDNFKKDLEVHDHSNQSQEKDKICEKVLEETQKSETYQEVEELIQCTLCWVTFANEAELNRHNLEFHIKREEVERQLKLISQESYQNFTCSFCHKGYKYEAYLIKHREICNGHEKRPPSHAEVEEIPVTSQAQHLSASQNELMCHICDKVYSRRDTVLAHIKEVHEQIFDFECNQCGKKFISNSKLRRHVKQMHSERM